MLDFQALSINLIFSTRIYMKHALIALAALAASGSASAEVILYGKVDLGVSSTTVKIKDPLNSKPDEPADQGLLVTGNNYENSRYGVKGSTSLGNGLKGAFNLEGGFDLATGKSSDARKTTVSLSGGFGTLTGGLDYTPYDNAWLDAMEYNNFSAMGAVFANGVHADRSNVKSALQYQTPDLSGFNAVVMYAPGGDATVAKSSSNYTGLGLNYANGPFAASLGYESAKPVGDGDKTNAWILTGSYNLGMATVYLGLEAADAAKAGKDSGFSLGVSLPLTKQATIALGYASEKTTNEGFYDGKSSGLGIQAIYNLQDNLAVYAGLTSTDIKSMRGQTLAPVGDSAATTTVNKFATGLRYIF
jgi:predicted porin